jgi:tetratricopeptide (TPR) repeat protein
MQRSKSNSLCLVSALCAALLSSIFAMAAEPPWLEVHSTHFTVITDAGEKKGREVALRFEQMRSVFALLLTKDRLNQSVPLTILAFKNDKSYYQIAPLHQGQPTTSPGFFLPGEDQNFIVLNLFEEEPWRAVAHDFATMLLNYNYPPAQGWFDEGLGEYFSSIRVDNKQVELGGDPELRPSVNLDLVGNQRDAHPPKSLVELLGAEVWLPLPDLFTMKHDTSTRNQGTHHTLYYAESWMVMHYLLHEKKLPETGAYFDLVLNKHVPVEDAIQQAYGMSSAQMEKAVKDYFHSQTPLLAALDSARQTNPAAAANAAGPGETYRFPAPVGPDDTVITVKPVPEADALALSADVAVRIPERRDAGLQQLRALAAAPTAADKKFEAKKQERRPTEDPDQLPTNAMGSPLAHRILAWDHIQHGEFEEATTDIADATALNPQDMWLRYYLAILKYRVAQAKHADMQGLPNMMLDLRSVLDWYPELAGAYDLLGVARNEGGSSLAAMQAERTAMNLSPRNELSTYHLAQIYVASKKWEASQALLERLKNSGNPQIATLARELLERSATERKYGIPVGTTTTQAKLAPQKSPFDVLEEDAAKREAAEKASQSTGSDTKRPMKFVKGRLVAVDCSNAPSAVLTVAAAGDTLKLHARDYKSLVLIGADDFSCEWRDRQVTVNYNPGGAKDGELVSLEVR